MVLAADKEVTRKQAGLQSFPVEDSVTIFKGALVCTNAAGYLVPAADTAGYKFAGIAYEKVDNTLSGHSQGGKSCRAYTEGVFELVATDITQVMVGQLLYAVDDGVVDETTTNSVCVGRLIQYVTTAKGWVDIGQRALSAVAGAITGDITFAGAISVASLGVVGTAILYGALYMGGTITAVGIIVNSTLGVAGLSSLTQVSISSSLGVAGATTLNGAVVCVSTLAIGGALTMHQVVNALQLPDSDPSVAGRLWSNNNVINRSTGV